MEKMEKMERMERIYISGLCSTATLLIQSSFRKCVKKAIYTFAKLE